MCMWVTSLHLQLIIQGNAKAGVKLETLGYRSLVSLKPIYANAY